MQIQITESWLFAPGNGRHAAKHILCWSKNQSCTDPEGFTQAMIEMFETEAQICTPEGIELDRVWLPCFCSIIFQIPFKHNIVTVVDPLDIAHMDQFAAILLGFCLLTRIWNYCLHIYLNMHCSIEARLLSKRKSAICYSVVVNYAWQLIALFLNYTPIWSWIDFHPPKIMTLEPRCNAWVQLVHGVSIQSR